MNYNEINILMSDNNIRIVRGGGGGGGLPVVHNQIKNCPILVQNLLKLHIFQSVNLHTGYIYLLILMTDYSRNNQNKSGMCDVTNIMPTTAN